MAKAVRVALIMDAEQFKRGLKDAEAAARRSGQQIKTNFTGQATRDIKEGEAAFRDFGVGMMAAAGVAAFGLYKTTQAASDLNEQVSQSGVVFKDAKGEIEAFAKSADAIGLSERAATQAANSFGIMFTKMGKGTDEAASMAVEFTKLAADLASFYNTTTDEAATALRSGLAGEMEPLKKYGILLDDATLKRRAYDMGLVESTTGVLPPLIKMQAAQAETMAQGAVAMGDATRTADGLAGRQRQLTADWENAQAALGEGLTPMLADAANGLSNMLEKVSELNEATGGNAGVIAGYGTVILGVAGAASFAIGSVRGMTENFGAAKVAMNNWTSGYPRVQAMGASLGKVAAGAAAGAAGLLLLQEAGKAAFAANGVTKDADRIADAVAHMASSGQLAGAASEDFNDLGVSLMLIQDNTEELSGWELNSLPELTGQLGAAQEAVDKYDKSIANMAKTDPEGATRALEVLRKAFEGTSITGETFTFAFDDTAAQMGDVEAGVAGAAAATDELGDATAGAAVEQYDFSKALEESRKNLEELLGLQSEALGVGMAYEASVDNLTESLKENGLTFDIGTEKGRANLSAVQEQTDAIIENGLAVLDQTGSVDQANAAINAQIEALRGQLTQAGYSKAKTDELIATLGLMPDQVTTTFVTAGYDETKIRLLELKRLLGEAQMGSTFNLLGGWGNNTAPRPDLRPPGRATGGPLSGGTAYLVGETGPELFVPGRNGTMLNAARTNAAMNTPAMAGGGGTTTIQVVLDGRVLAEAQAPYLRDYEMRRR